MSSEQPDADEPARGAAPERLGFAAGVVLGAILGAGLALLYAPDRGEKTRSWLRRRLRRLRKQSREGLDRAGRTREELLRRRRRIRAQLERLRDAF